MTATAVTVTMGLKVISFSILLLDIKTIKLIYIYVETPFHGYKLWNAKGSH